jgi:hypothetical protein
MFAAIQCRALSSRPLSKNVKIRIYRTTILPVVLYGCEICYLIFSEDHRIRMFENRVMRIFRPKRTEVTGGWRNLHEKLCSLCSSLSIIRMIKSRIRWAGHVARKDIGYWWESQAERDH